MHTLFGVPGGSGLPCDCEIGRDHDIEDGGFCTVCLENPCECPEEPT